MHRLTPLFLVLSLLVLRPASAAEAGDFASWLHGMRQDAQAQGITSATLDRAFAGVKPIPRVIELDHSQPETTLTFAEYQERVASPERRQAAHEQPDFRRRGGDFRRLSADFRRSADYSSDRTTNP